MSAKEYLRMKIKNEYIKSITTLVSGSMIAQLVTILCAPIITRIFTPDDLGIYALVTGAITIFGAVTALRYDLCIVSASDEEKVFPLVKLSFLITSGFSLIIVVGYIIYFRTLDNNYNPFVLAIMAGVLVWQMGIINIATAYNNRHKDYKLITKTYIQRVTSQNAFNLIAGFLNFNAIGLCVSHIIGYSAGIRGQIMPIWKERKRLSLVTTQEMKDVTVEYSKQATLSTPATLANGLSYSLINYFIEALFSTALVGYYSISYRVLGLPISVVSANISRVFLEKASREYDEKGNFVDTYRSTMKISIIIGIAMGLAMYFLAPLACEIFFGKGWGVAGTYIRILTPMFVMRFMAGGINSSAIIVNKQHIDFVIQGLLTLLVVLIFITSKVLKLKIEVFLMIINITFSVVYVIYIYLFWICAKNKKNTN